MKGKITCFVFVRLRKEKKPHSSISKVIVSRNLYLVTSWTFSLEPADTDSNH